MKTFVFDLDSNRHATSRTYEKFSQEGRFGILAELGYPINRCIEENLILVPEFTQVRFLAQQFSGATLRIDTTAHFYESSKILWDHKIYGENEKLACELKLFTHSIDKKLNPFNFKDSNEKEPTQLIHPIENFTNSCTRLTHKYPILYSDMNCFWKYSPEAIWKIFEEGRWLFFSEIIDLHKITEMDTTSFFMGGRIQIHKMPIAGEKTILNTWIERVEKIRFYFRQDLVREDGTLLASMRDEQLFISISKSRPRKAPDDFLEITRDYIEFK
jgi:acyl-CoA thioesterase FadM